MTVSCHSGRSFTADAAVVTLPLGVLKRRAVKFNPELPEEKTARAPGKLCSLKWFRCNSCHFHRLRASATQVDPSRVL